MKNNIVLTEEAKEQMKQLIIEFFDKERGEELGEIGSFLILDFVTNQLAPFFYNQGIEDSYTYMRDNIEDLFALKVIKR